MVSTSDERHSTTVPLARSGASEPSSDRDRMRIHAVGRRPAMRLLICSVGVLTLAGFISGVLPWCWTQAARLLSLHAPMRLPAGDAARAMWRLLMRGGWSTPYACISDSG